MRLQRLVGTMALTFLSTVAHAQFFGSGIVFDPTQSGHAIQQILQDNQLYTTTVETTRNVIAAYNLAQRMASLPENTLHLIQQSRPSAMDRSDSTCEHLRQFDSLDECRYDWVWSVCCKSDVKSAAHRTDLRLFISQHSGPTGNCGTRGDG